MLVSTKGLVLHRMKYSETSLICKIYTEELGLKTYMVKGARRPKSRQRASLLQAMTLLDLVVYDSSRKTMHTIKEMRPFHLYQEIPFNTVKGSLGLFMTEVLSKSIREEEENAELFHFASRSFMFLDGTDLPISNFHLFFMVKLSPYLGIEPYNNWSEENGYFDMAEGCFSTVQNEVPYSVDLRSGEIIAGLLAAQGYEDALLIKMSRDERERALKTLLKYYEFHLDSFKNIQSLRVLKEVLS